MYSEMSVDKESLFKTIINENKTVDRYTFKTIAQINKTKQPILILIVYSQQMVIIYVHCNFEDWLHLQNCITPNASSLLNMNHNMCLQKKFNIQVLQYLCNIYQNVYIYKTSISWHDSDPMSELNDK